MGNPLIFRSLAGASRGARNAARARAVRTVVRHLSVGFWGTAGIGGISTDVSVTASGIAGCDW